MNAETLKGAICKRFLNAEDSLEMCKWECNQMVATIDEAHRLLTAASHALKSYAFGNVATDLAEEMAESIDRFLLTGEPQTLAGKGKP